MPISFRLDLGHPDTETEAILNEAAAAASSDVCLSNATQKADDIGDSIEEALEPYKILSDWYRSEENEELISAAASTLRPENLDAAVTEFWDVSGTILIGLDVLANVHPVARVAVDAFKLVVTLDQKRRENNKKVVALKIVMQQMVIELFQLKDVREPQVPLSDSDMHEGGPIHKLVRDIARDIRQAGFACDRYVRKNFFIKTAISFIYEEELASYMQLFEEYKQRLRDCLMIGVAVGVQSLQEQVTDLRKLMMNMLEKLDSPKERDAREFVQNKGMDRIMKEDKLLRGLIDLVGENEDRLVQGEPTSSSSQPLEIIRDMIKKDMKTSVNEAFTANFEIYEAKLDMHLGQIKDRIPVSDSISIKDEVLRAVWENLGWKGSVKARHFVLALQDYFSSHPPDDEEDRWALDYLDLANVQHILEAIDDNGTGFITVQELNVFTDSKPQGWSVLVWLAYWSKGWYASVDRYKQKIYNLLLKMQEDSKQVEPYNEGGLYRLYWKHPAFDTIDRLMRSTKPLSSDYLRKRKLIKYIKYYCSAEEERLQANLERVKWAIDDASTLSLIAGPGRIERYIYPLLYLVLQRHALVIRIAKNHCLPPEVFKELPQSLYTITNALTRRVADFSTLFQYARANGKDVLGNYAFGMFRAVNEALEPTATTTAAKHNSLAKYSCENTSIQEEVYREMTRQDSCERERVLKQLQGKDSCLEPSDPAHFEHEEVLDPETPQDDQQVANSEVPVPYNRRTMGKLVGFKCDLCKQQPSHVMFSCLTCINEDTWETSNAIDLCQECAMSEEDVQHDLFEHDPSHLLVRSFHHTPDAQRAWIIPRARAVGERTKLIYKKHRASKEVEGLKCSCCHLELSLPFFVCLCSVPEAYICTTCESKQQTPNWKKPTEEDKKDAEEDEDGKENAENELEEDVNHKEEEKKVNLVKEKQELHDATHSLVLILNSDRIKKKARTDERLDALEKRLTRLLDSRLEKLETFLPKQEGDISEERFMERLDKRLALLEVFIRALKTDTVSDM